MFLVEWNRPCSVGFAEVKLGPGVNEVQESVWNSLETRGYKRSIETYIANGDLVVHDSEKPTQAVVAKTYNIDLLEAWLDDAKGPLKGAIRTRIKEIKTEWAKRDKKAG